MNQPFGYKVVTTDLKSLGLRKNPNILTYPLGEWFELPRSELRKGKGDYGGIWLCKTKSAAKKLKKYMMDKHQVATRVFKAYINEVLYSNSYRIKTDGIMLAEEMDIIIMALGRKV